MSTFPEMQRAFKIGINIIGISCLSNYAAGITEEHLSHNDVLKVVQLSQNNLRVLVQEIIKII